MKSYDEFVSAMSRTFTSRAGYSPDEASDIGIRIRVLAGELYNLQSNIQWLKQQVFPQTAFRLPRTAKGLTAKGCCKG